MSCEFNSWPVRHQVTTLGNCSHPCASVTTLQTVQFGTGPTAVMLYGWEGNHSSTAYVREMSSPPKPHVGVWCLYFLRATAVPAGVLAMAILSVRPWGD